MKKFHPESLLGLSSEPNFRVFYREKIHNDAEYMYSPVIKDKTTYNLVKLVHPSETYELNKLGNKFFRQCFRRWRRLFSI